MPTHQKKYKPDDLTEYTNPKTGECLTVREFRQLVKTAETTGTSMSKEEFMQHLNKWQQRLIQR